MKATGPEQVKEWQEQMLVAYGEIGTVTGACDRLGFPTIRHKRWMRTDQDYASRFRAVEATRKAVGEATGKSLSTGRPVNVVHRRGQQARMIAAYSECGNVSKATRQVQVPLRQHYRWMDEDPEYTERFRAAEQARRDAGLRVGRNYGPWSEESKAKMSKSKSEWWERQPQEVKDKTLRTLNKANLTIRGGKAMTQIEADVLTALNRAGVFYQFHAAVGPPDRLYVADVLVESPRLDVEVDGEYWHRPETAAREQERDATLAACGITVLRLTQAEVEAGDFSRLAEALKEGVG